MSDVRLDDYLVPGEIRHQPWVIRRVLQEVDPLTEPIADSVATAGVRDVVMTGCGDSLFSAMGAAFSFLRFSRRMTIPSHALQYSRGLYRSGRRDTLVCALSYSGETRRTLEAAIAARSRGAQLLAVTVDREGSIARLADHVLPNVSPREQERSNCRTGSFQAAYLALVMLAAHLAVRQGDAEPSTLRTLRDEVKALAAGIEADEEQARADGQRAAEILRRGRTFYFLGGGEAHAAALYASAKLYETSSLPAVPQETEQFAHCEIFSLEPDSVVIVIALRGPFFDRAVEVADASRTIGATVIGVSNDPAFGEHADHFLLTPTEGFDDLALSRAVVPLQWMAFYDAVWRGQDPDLVRHKGVNSPLIRQAPIWSAEDYVRADGATAADALSGGTR